MLEKSFMINGPNIINNNGIKKEKQIITKRKVTMKSPFLHNIQLLIY